MAYRYRLERHEWKTGTCMKLHSCGTASCLLSSCAWCCQLSCMQLILVPLFELLNSLCWIWLVRMSKTILPCEQNYRSIPSERGCRPFGYHHSIRSLFDRQMTCTYTSCLVFQCPLLPHSSACTAVMDTGLLSVAQRQREPISCWMFWKSFFLAANGTAQ